MNSMFIDEYICPGQGLRGFVKDLHSPKGIEIGCETGKTSKFLLEQNPNLILYIVDPFENYVDWNGVNLNNMSNLYHHTMKVLDPYKDRYKHFRMYSDDAAPLMPDNEFDFIFIDGLHTYDQVLKDCKNFYSKIKKNGFFAGHDFGAIEGVRKAVLEFAESVGKEVRFTESDSWFWYK